MINKTIIDAILKVSTPESKNDIIKMFIEHIHQGMSYNDDKVNNILAMLVDKSMIKTKEDINFDYIKEHFDKWLWRSEDYNIRNVKFYSVDNIDCIVSIRYEYIEKLNEDNENISWKESTINISWIDYPEVLKKS